MSPRLMVNIAYRHLRGPLQHLRDCGTRCGSGCVVDAFNEALNQPVTRADREADERWKRNAEALMRGEIPGRREGGGEGEPRAD